jgi:phosphatidylinositol alpha-1,6-mannosyltransferase
MQAECLIVTQCFYPDVGGIEGLMTGLADYCANGRAVTVLAERIRRKQAAPSLPKPYEIFRFSGPRPWRRWRKRVCLESILKRRGSGIAGIFVDSWKSVEALPAHLERPVTTLAHGMEFPPDASPGKKRRIAAALARCSAVIANSRYTADLVRPHLSVHAGRLHIIHPPIAPLAEPEASEVERVRDRIGGGHPVIATVARLEPRKGIDAVIRAMPDVRIRYPGCVYAVAGAGGDRQRLEQLATALNVREAVHFLGRVSTQEKAALLARTDVFAMPVRREGPSVEGFGMSYSEAGWFGVPSLAGRDGGAGEAVLHGETGLVCDGANQSGVTRGLISLLDDEALRKRLGAAARDRVRRDLVWPAAVGRYLKSFEEF